ncbi:MAG: hypothetical protein M5U05_04145 [Anaerolineales bacterium]|nr:hypothetical protein [Anaerolineales bacterium]
MVNKSRHYQEQIEPPQPMDESWWEAVLAQEDEQIESNLGRSARASAAVSHWDELRHDQLGEDEYLNWEQAFELYEQDQVIRLAVSGCNRGGCWSAESICTALFRSRTWSNTHARAKTRKAGLPPISIACST